MTFSEAVRSVRRQSNLSQQAFADKLGVSFSTVNRWENGRHIPNRMAINTIKAFCCENRIEFKYHSGEEK